MKERKREKRNEKEGNCFPSLSKKNELRPRAESTFGDFFPHEFASKRERERERESTRLATGSFAVFHLLPVDSSCPNGTAIAGLLGGGEAAKEEKERKEGENRSKHRSIIMPPLPQPQPQQVPNRVAVAQMTSSSTASPTTPRSSGSPARPGTPEHPSCSCPSAAASSEAPRPRASRPRRRSTRRKSRATWWTTTALWPGSLGSG